MICQKISNRRKRCSGISPTFIENLNDCFFLEQSTFPNSNFYLFRTWSQQSIYKSTQIKNAVSFIELSDSTEYNPSPLRYQLKVHQHKK